MDEQPDAGDDEEQHRRQRVHEEGDLDPEVARADPLVERDVVFVAAEDHAGEDDHGEEPGEPHQGGRDHPGPIDRPLGAGRHVPGLAQPVVQRGRDDAVGTGRVGEIVRVPGVWRRLGLLRLAGDGPELRVVDRCVVVVVAVRGFCRMVLGGVVRCRLLVMAVAVAVDRHAIEPRTDEDGEEESCQRQQRNEGDEQLHGQRPIPSGRCTRRPRGSGECG